MAEHLYKGYIIEKCKAGYQLYDAERLRAWDVQYQRHPNYELGVIVNPIHLPQKLGEVKAYIDNGLPLSSGHWIVCAETRDQVIEQIGAAIPKVEPTASVCYQWVVPVPPGVVAHFVRLARTLGDEIALNKDYFTRYHYWAGYDHDGLEVWRDSCPYGYGDDFHFLFQGSMCVITITSIDIVRCNEHWFWRMGQENKETSSVSTAELLFRGANEAQS